MPNASVSGLVSGLDTRTLINQMMQIEAQPQTLLKNKVSAEQSSLSSLQDLNSKLLTVATRAGELAKVASWSPFTATSSSDKVAARVTSDAATSLSFRVDKTAASHQVGFDPAALDTVLTTAVPPEVTISFTGGGSTTVNTGDGTLGGLVKALNQPGSGFRAVTIDIGGGQHRVLVESEKSGGAYKFSFAGLPVASADVRVGQDAEIFIGGGSLKSSTNSFAGVISGLDITLNPGVTTGTVVDITVARDTKAMTDSVQALVDAANAVLTDIASLTAYKTSTTAGGPLAGDATLRSLRQELLSSITGGVGTTSLADVGVELDRYGKITFDPKVFTDAYTADPAGTANRFAATATWEGTGQATLAGSTWRTAAGPHTIDAGATPTIDEQPAALAGSLLTGKSGTTADGLAVTVSPGAVGTLRYAPGFAARLAAIAERASDSTAGTVTAAIKGRTSSIDSLEDAIAGWDVRLTKRRESLDRQYAALEVALQGLQNQSQWLAGQIAGLPSYSSGS